MKISEAIGACIIALSAILCSLFILALFLAVAVAICAAPIYLVCAILGVQFSWIYAFVLVGILIIVYAIVSTL